MVSPSKLIALSFVSTVLAKAPGVHIYRKNDLAVSACTDILQETVLYFDETDKAGFCNVNLQQALGSMAHCLKSLPAEVGVRAFIKNCEPYNLSMQQFNDAYDNATQFLVTNTKTYPGFNITEVFNLPVKINQKILDGAFASAVGRYYTYNRGNYYGWALMIYWFAVILFSGLVRLICLIAPKKVQSFNGKLSNTFRKYITLPALGKKKVVTRGKVFKVFEFVIPTRIESIYLIVWFAMALAFNTANFHHETPNLYWTSRTTEMCRKVGVRSGIIVLYVIPQMVLFAGRNNFLQWVSGWSYSRFNTMHRWMGRLTFILSATHSLALIINSFGIDMFYNRNKRGYIRWGWLAFIASFILCVHSMSFFRKKHYELFVLSHNLLATLYIVGVWIHVRKVNFQQMMYATSAVWALDKIIRLLRMAWFGVRNADVQLIAGETLRVSVSRPSYWKPYPLSYAYIYFFKKSCFWQSHPFTIVDSVLEENMITFYIKVKGGMSNSLYQYLNTQPDQRAFIKCSIEGPYGPKISLQHYKSVSYLAGGNGIPGLFYSAIHLAKKSTGQKLKLYWVILHWKSIEWIYEELKSLEGLNVEPIIYVTQFSTTLEDSFVEKFENHKELADSGSSNKDWENETERNSDTEVEKVCGSEVENDMDGENVACLMSRLHFIDFREGRPDLESVIKTDIAESIGSIAFVACGHDLFVDESRKTVVENLENGKRVDFHDSMQVW